MKRYTLSYIYRGDLSDDLTSKILSLAENTMEHSSESSTMKKKVYFIMVESLQNLTRHHQVPQQKEVADGSSFFVIQRLEKEYYITSGNVVENKKVDFLKANLEKINGLDKEDLKEYYKEILSQGEFSSKGGAGLGFIEMARKSGNKLAFDFKKLNDEFSHFYFQTTISLPESEHLPANENINENRLAWLENVDKLILEKNLNLIYQVDFTQESLIGILSMAEGNLGSTKELVMRKKIFNIIIELLQNIYKHADDPDTSKDGKSGIFMLGEKNGVYTLTTGNLVLNNRVDSIRKTIQEVNDASFDNLDALYNRIMMSDEQRGQKGAGLGFADIKLKSRNNLLFHFSSVNAEYSFFEIQVKLS